MGSKFDTFQEQAMHHTKGPCMVIAAPGSGKTTVITHRTAYLIKEKKVDPSRILVVTFTKAAATEMKERFLNLMGEEYTKVSFGTFHAIFFAILKNAYKLGAGNIVREEQRYELMRGLIVKYHLECEDEKELTGELLGEIGLVKNTGTAIEHYYATSCGEDVFRKLYQEYQSWMRNHRLLDFDDMLLYTWELFNKRKDILKAWQDKFLYILVDEFQDINKLQYDIIKLLALPENNLFIVGDDDQSIYRFRGARPEIMLHFPKDYPDAKVIRMGNNYRSQAYIVSHAAKLISHNSQRFEKEIHAVRGKGEEISFAMLENAREESIYLIEQIKTMQRQKGANWADFAVLARTNKGLFYLTERLVEYNIPFRSKERMPDIYEHFIAKDLFSYLRLARGERSRGDFLCVMNKPKRYIERDALDEAQVSFGRLKCYYAEKPWVLKRLYQMENDLKQMRKMNPFAAINFLRKAVGYEDYLREYASYRGIKEEELFEVLDFLQEASRGFASLEAWEAHIQEYREERKKQEQEKNTTKKKDAVTLATLHSSKGLEYPYVFLIDVNEGNMPYKKASLPHELEEERRMFYVGMTRAKEKLWLLAVKEQNNRKVQPSPYIAECH